MICDICFKAFEKPKSLSNHRRWHNLHQYSSFQKLYKKQASVFNKGQKNGMWKGKEVQYHGLHGYIRRNLPKPKYCGICQLPKKLEIANKSGKYLRKFTDWEWICRRCHMVKDGRLDRLHP